MSSLKLYEEFIKSLSEQEVSETNNSYKIFLELLETDIYDARVKNPETGRAIKVASALKKDPRTEVHQIARDMVDKSKGSDEEEPIKTFSPITKKKLTERLGGIDGILKDKDEDTQTRGKLFKEYTEEFINAKNEKEQVEAIQKLIDANLIQGHSGGKKIYAHPNTLLPRNTMYGGNQGSSITVEMNRLIKKNNMHLEVRQSSADRTLADMSGKHNEAGVVAYLHPTKENQDSYKANQKSLTELGGDEKKFDEINKKSAQMIKDLLPKGSTITSAEQIGGNKKRQKELGIDDKVDPTDLIIFYKDKDGKEHTLKVSAKTYSDPNNITMKNSGTLTAGEDYLGKELGSKLDKEFAELRKEYKWDSSTPEDEKKELKVALKKAYLKKWEAAMQELSKTKEGQEQLMKMWKSVHGCGKNVHTQVINKETGEVTIHPPDHYCKPSPPFEVKYDGTRMVVNMGGKDKGEMEMILKTEEGGSPVLLFKHVKRKNK